MACCSDPRLLAMYEGSWRLANGSVIRHTVGFICESCKATMAGTDDAPAWRSSTLDWYAEPDD